MFIKEICGKVFLPIVFLFLILYMNICVPPAFRPVKSKENMLSGGGRFCRKEIFMI